MFIHRIHFDTVDSTHLFAKASWATFPSDSFTSISAEEQTGGIGRKGTKWLSPKGVNLYVTFCFVLNPKEGPLETLGALLAASLISVIKQQGVCVKIKWPNDLQISGKKVAGILVDVVSEKKHSVVFASFGLNVNMEATDGIGQPATSLKLEADRANFDRKQLLYSVEKTFLKDLSEWKKVGFEPFARKLSSVLVQKGQMVTVQDRTRQISGICEGLGARGELLIRQADGSQVAAHFGELLA